MKFQQVLLTSALVAAGFSLPVAAQAEVTGFYVSLGGGLNGMSNVNEEKAYSGVLSPNPGFSIDVGTPTGTQGPGPNGSAGATHYNTGPAFAGSIGYGLGHNIRIELGLSYTENGVTRLNKGTGLSVNGVPQGLDPLGLGYTGREKKLSLMANAIYDFNELGKRLDVGLVPYIGAGIGFTHIDWGGVTRFGGGENFTGAGLGIVNKITNAFYTADDVLAIQGMVGVSYDIPGIPGLALTSEARLLALPSGFLQRSHLTLTFRPTPTPVFSPVITGPGSSVWGTDVNYTFLVGVRYAFNASGVAPRPVAAVPAPAPAAVPAVAPARSYLVFFDWDKAELTDRARQIVAEAASNSVKAGVTKIEVDGHTDTSGTVPYNKALSLRRAESVAAELVKDGVAKSAISIFAFGESRPLVPTAPGVREPQNRRVEIILK